MSTIHWTPSQLPNSPPYFCRWVASMEMLVIQEHGLGSLLDSFPCMRTDQLLVKRDMILNVCYFNWRNNIGFYTYMLVVAIQDCAHVHALTQKLLLLYCTSSLWNCTAVGLATSRIPMPGGKMSRPSSTEKTHPFGHRQTELSSTASTDDSHHY